MVSFTLCSLKGEILPLYISQEAMSLKTLKKKEIFLIASVLKCMTSLSRCFLLGSG